MATQRDESDQDGLEVSRRRCTRRQPNRTSRWPADGYSLGAVTAADLAAPPKSIEIPVSAGQPDPGEHAPTGLSHRCRSCQDPPDGRGRRDRTGWAVQTLVVSHRLDVSDRDRAVGDRDCRIDQHPYPDRDQRGARGARRWPRSARPSTRSGRRAQQAAQCQRATRLRSRHTYLRDGSSRSRLHRRGASHSLIACSLEKTSSRNARDFRASRPTVQDQDQPTTATSGLARTDHLKVPSRGRVNL